VIVRRKLTSVFQTEMFAMTEMAYVLTRMVQCFKSIESRDRSEWKERFGVNLSSLNGVKVELTARKRGCECKPSICSGPANGFFIFRFDSAIYH
jgi:hypothetical protein